MAKSYETVFGKKKDVSSFFLLWLHVVLLFFHSLSHVKMVAEMDTVMMWSHFQVEQLVLLHLNCSFNGPE